MSITTLPGHSAAAGMASGDLAFSAQATSNGTAPAGITSNDFLTLLVTEMKNQDPTANSDPNEWINQLVQVNSLQQLIEINQTLSSDVAPAAGQVGKSSPFRSSAAIGSLQGDAANPSMPATVPSAITTLGNLGISDSSPAAKRIAEALSGLAR